MSEINKTILLCFKDYDDLFKYRRESMNRLERYCDNFRNGDTVYRLGLMDSSTACGLSASEVFFVNCSIDDCEDEDFKLTLRVLEKWGTKVHYDPKDTEKFQEELQAEFDRIDSVMKLYGFCGSGEFEIQRTDNRFSGYQKCSPLPFEQCEPRDDSFDKITFEQREDGRYFRKFATVGELIDALQKLPRDYKIFCRNYYSSDSPSLYYFGDKSFEII